MILVAYLVGPGDEYGEAAIRFCDSYLKHPAGAPHDLLLVQKQGSYTIPSSGEWCKQPELMFYVNHPNEGFDIGSLQQVCDGYAEYTLICWFGSHSRLLADDWLQKMSAVALLPGVGAAGATGSFESGVAHQFPNAHLRTNGLVFRPQMLKDLQFGPSYSRTDCYEFEHGIHSFTRRLERSGLTPMVVGNDGVGYTQDNWAESSTYRQGEQENLLVADKHTDAYLAADADLRESLSKLAGMR